jgi:putative nucleotidyltransferase with HDIG domain
MELDDGKGSAMEADEFFKKLDQIREIPTLPVILSRLNALLTDEQASIFTIKMAIESDQAITSKILKMVNSAFYGFQSKISNIPHALALLGFNSVHNAVISIAVFDAFSKAGSSVGGWDPKIFWEHSVKAAVISKYLARQTGVAVPEDSFVGGLLHDIGKVIIIQFFPEKFVRIRTVMQEQGTSFAAAEKHEYPPFDHARIGAYIARKWQFPASLIEAIQYHHVVTTQIKDPGLLFCVHLANRIAHGDDDLQSSAGKLHAASAELWDRIQPCLQGVATWLPLLEKEIEAASQFFRREN